DWARGSFHMAPTYLGRFPGSASIGRRGSPFLVSPAMPDTQTGKQQLRKEALARRAALPSGWRRTAVVAMQRAAREIDLRNGEIVSGFWPIRDEADVRPILEYWYLQGARACLPAVIAPGLIVFREYRPG